MEHSMKKLAVKLYNEKRQMGIHGCLILAQGISSFLCSNYPYKPDFLIEQVI
jgi:hypothetical protein